MKMERSDIDGEAKTDEAPKITYIEMVTRKPKQRK